MPDTRSLKFRLAQLESSDLQALLTIVNALNERDPEKWGDVVEALQAAATSEILWADWDTAEYTHPDPHPHLNSIPIIWWDIRDIPMMGQPIAPGIARLLTQHTK